MQTVGYITQNGFDCWGDLEGGLSYALFPEGITPLLDPQDHCLLGRFGVRLSRWGRGENPEQNKQGSSVRVSKGWYRCLQVRKKPTDTTRCLRFNSIRKFCLLDLHKAAITAGE